MEMDPKNMSALDKITMSQNMLDKLTDAQGRAKCGYIYIINEFLTELRNDVLVMQERIKDFETASPENSTPIIEEKVE